MNKLIPTALALSFVFGVTNLQAQASTADPIQNMVEEYQSIDGGGDLVDHGFFIHFSNSAAEIKQTLAESDNCSQAKGFKKTSVKLLSQWIRNDLELAIELLHDGTDSCPEAMTSMNEKIVALEKYLSDKALRICVDKSVPAYSDGRELRFVEVNGELSFLFENGRPD